MSRQKINGPQMDIDSSNLERTLNLMRLSERGNLKEKVRETILILGDCFPSGNRRDSLGTTFRQMLYIISLAGFDRDEANEFCRIAREAGGLDSNQAHHLIEKLKRHGGPPRVR